MAKRERDIYRIGIKNLWIWLADQFKSPGTILNRKAWGVFSVYSHLRRSDRKAKKVFATKDKALKEAEVLGKRHDAHFSVYKCLYCDGWHVAKDAMKKVEQAEGHFDVKLRSDKLDVAKALSTNVPDIMPVYGGIRGRTLSSTKQRHAWKAMAEAGIRQIIDLRQDYSGEEYKELCRQYGMDYFFYPVNWRPEIIAVMVRRFPEFCQLIEKGNFYIACAMGLHRTDIALCCYWMFYGADKGVEPPALNGYVKRKGLKTDKMMRVLGAFYKYVEDTTGKPPIPLEVFKERKRILNELSKSIV